MRDLQLNGNSSHTPHSESSESDRIAALHGSTLSRQLPTDTIGLQQYLADLRGEAGRLAKVSPFRAQSCFLISSIWHGLLIRFCVIF